MPTQVIMPLLGESVLEGTISRWLKAKGDRVAEYEPILEVNTDKVDSEIPSPASGILLEILVPEGTTVNAGTLLGWIGEPQDDLPSSDKTAFKAAPAMKNIFPSQASPEAVPATATPRPGRDQGLGFISPVVAKIASEQGIDLTRVHGTGQRGRITKKDILAFIEHRQQAAPLPDILPPLEPKEYTVPSAPSTAISVSEPALGEILPHTSVRRAIADHMVMSKHTSPHVTTIMEADLSRVVADRQSNKGVFARDGVNLTFTAYFFFASVSALKAFPIVNSSWRDEGIMIHREINIGMATSLSEAGLIVPVIKNADGLSLLGIARAINDLANRARLKQLKPDEVKGGTFTITNHGTSGSLLATPIINQPQGAILGIGLIQKRVVVINDAIAIRPMVYLSLTFDHRVLDGVIADYFLGKVVESLQNWT